MGKVVGAAALEAATMAGVAAAAERASARAFHYLTGFWPAKKKNKPDDDEQAAGARLTTRATPRFHGPRGDAVAQPVRDRRSSSSSRC